MRGMLLGAYLGILCAFVSIDAQADGAACVCTNLGGNLATCTFSCDDCQQPGALASCVPNAGACPILITQGGALGGAAALGGSTPCGPGAGRQAVVQAQVVMTGGQITGNFGPPCANQTTFVCTVQPLPGAVAYNRGIPAMSRTWFVVLVGALLIAGGAIVYRRTL